MAIILVCWAVAAIFKMADMNFHCPIYRRYNIDRKLIIVSMSVFSGLKKYGNYNGLWGLWKPFSKWLT